jgi:hypothetical protein
MITARDFSAAHTTTPASHPVFRADSDPQFRRALERAMYVRYGEPVRLSDIDRDRWAAIYDVASDMWAKQEAAWRDLCPPLMQETDPARLPQDALNRVMAWQHGSTGLVLHGSTGAGKTRMVWLLLRRLFVHEFIAPKVFRAGELEDAMITAFKLGTSGKLMSELRTAPILFIDDFGKDKFTERFETFLFTVINDRCEFKRPIFLTTNYVGQKLIDRFADIERGLPALRRLREFCQPIEVKPQQQQQ